MKNLKKRYIFIFMLIGLGFIGLGTSYAFFTNKREEHGKLNIVVGDLTYKLESNDLVNHQIVVGANEVREIVISLTSLNSVDSKYELYYTLDQENSSVKAGYHINTRDAVLGRLNKNSSKTITVVVRNESSKDTTVTFGVMGGLLNNELVLVKGKSLNQVVSNIKEEWEYFLDAGNYAWNNYHSLEEAMSDANIYTTIFNNKNSMQYLVNHINLIKSMKTLGNYSSTLVPYLLATTLYTDIQKYNYSLPFYIYNKGSYSSSLFSLQTKSIKTYWTPSESTKTVRNTGSYLLFSSIGQYPNACERIVAYSSVLIKFDNYLSEKINVSYLSSSFPASVGTVSRYPGLGGINNLDSLDVEENTPIQNNGITTSNISTLIGSYYPAVRMYSCNDSKDSQGNILKHDATVYITQWWFE